ncbi:Vsp/OspC family lipoprotein [Borrelia turicatae]|nr:Vsp/OspC family lipoprotein [Borrelia turicatae]
MSCNNSGTIPKDGHAAKSDGTLIDLATITKNIKDTVAFAKSVKDVHTLVMSIDELAKVIGKKIDANGLATESAHNGSLIAGAYSVIEVVDTKLGTLAGKVGLSSDLKAKVGSAKKESTAFLAKVKADHANLGKEDVDDAHAKNVIDVTDGTKDKGASELIKLNTVIDELLKAAEDAVTAAINALSIPAKSDSPTQSN